MFQSPSGPPTPFQDLQECINLRQRYMEASLQRPGDNPKDGEMTVDGVTVGKAITHKQALMSGSQMFNFHDKWEDWRQDDDVDDRFEWSDLIFNLEGGVYKVDYGEKSSLSC